MNSSFVDIHTHNYRDDIISIVCFMPCDLPEDFNGKYSLGVHPWQADVEQVKLLENLAANAIGEIGLDYSEGKPEKTLQREVFSLQLTLAQELQLPVIIHCVKAYQDILLELKNHKLKAVIFHGFIGSPEQAEMLLAHGYYLSFSPVAFRSPKTLRAMKICPKDKLFLETDDSDLKIEQMYSLACNTLNVDLKQLKQQILKNYNIIFHT